MFGISETNFAIAGSFTGGVQPPRSSVAHFTAASADFTSVLVFAASSENRIICREAADSGFIALITCEGSSESARQAEPDDAQTPSLSRRISIASDWTPGNVMFACSQDAASCGHSIPWLECTQGFLLPKRLAAVALCLHSLKDDHAWFSGFTHANDQRHALCSAAMVALLVTAMNEGRHWRLAPNVQRANAFRRMKLVAG